LAAKPPLLPLAKVTAFTVTVFPVPTFLLLKDDKLELDDARKLLSLIRETFNPLRIAKSAVQNIISTV